MSVIAVRGFRSVRALRLGVFVLLFGTGWQSGHAHAQHPLEPPETSSPRQTLSTLLRAMDQMLVLIRDEGTGMRSREGLQRMLEFDVRSVRTLDLSEVALEARIKTSQNVQVYLYEVLSRIEPTPMEEVPGPDEIKANPGLDRWTVPHSALRSRVT